MDQSHPYGFGADLQPADSSVNHCPNLLDIRFEFPLGDAGGLDTHSAEIFRFASPSNAPAGLRFLTEEKTLS
jgi:hypothetical protein